MLDLDSPRWATLESHIAELPPPATCVREWKKSIGTRDEVRSYDRLFNQYLHQLTSTSCAYAVVPHVVSQLHKLKPSRRLSCLSDISFVELQREAVPKDLKPDYLRAIDVARREATALLSERWAPADFSRLLGVLTALHAQKHQLASALLQTRRSVDRRSARRPVVDFDALRGS